MAKAFGGMGMGAAAAPRMTTNGSPGGIRPMPRPANLGGIETERAPARQGGFLAQQFGPQGSEHRYEMAMEMLKAAMTGAAGSNSPALAFLTPLLGSAIGAKATDMRDKYVGDQQRQMTEGLLGGPLNPQAQQAMEVLNNPDAPDYLRQIAATMFKQNAVPVGGVAPSSRRSSGGGGGRGSGGGRPSGGGSKPTRLTYIMRDPDGIIRGYNPATGKREVVQNADAPPVAAPAAAAAGAAPVTPLAQPALPADPKPMPSDPTDDAALLQKYGVN